MRNPAYDYISCADCGEDIEVRSTADSDIYFDDSTDTLCRRCYVEHYLGFIVASLQVLRLISVDTVPLEVAVRQIRKEEGIES